MLLIKAFVFYQAILWCLFLSINYLVGFGPFNRRIEGDEWWVVGIFVTIGSISLTNAYLGALP